jgi:hypothetical protein
MSFDEERNAVSPPSPAAAVARVPSVDPSSVCHRIREQIMNASGALLMER